MSDSQTTATTMAAGPSRRLGLLASAAACACLLVAALGAGPAIGAEFGIASIDGAVTNEDGSTDIQAGSHPYAMSTTIRLKTETNSHTGLETPAENPKDIEVDLPAGFIGNPNAAPKCTLAQLGGFECPDDTAIGTVNLDLVEVGETGPMAVYNVQPPAGTPARFAFTFLSAIVTIDARVRTGFGYGISVKIRNIPETATMSATTLMLWGVPADSSHDGERGECAPSIFNATPGALCRSSAGREPFLTLPTDCAAGPFATTARVDSWLHPGEWKEASYVSHLADGTPFGVDGCGEVGFAPQIAVAPESPSADTPSAMNIDLSVPQNENPGGYATANLKRSVTMLPEGVRVNPAAAGGLTGCSEAEIALHSTAPPSCPDSSRIGRVEIVSPLLATPLTGAVYEARQGENPFGSNLAFYTYSESEGVVIKLAAQVHTDPRTGQVTTTFDDNPQLAFSHFRLHFFGGSRAPLATPAGCGAFTTTEQASPWSASDPDHPTAAETIESSSSFRITSGPGGSACPSGDLSPGFEAGTTSPLAGGYSPFTMKLSRADGTQQFTGLEAALPPGLLAKLAGAPYCPDTAIAAAAAASAVAEAASPSCPAASQVGTVQVGAGAGSSPLYQSGKAYLAGPYKGAPLSLAIVTPALAGPLDLGAVVVRAAMYVDPTTAQVTVKSDPIPTNLVVGGDGFPLDLRSLDISIDKGDFTVNPTSCEASAVSGTIGGLAGATADVSNRFQVGGCAALGFKPKLGFRLYGKTNRGAHPKLRAVLRMPASGAANVARAAVLLPKSDILDQSHIKTVCTRVQYAAGAGGGAECPAGSIYGYARAWSPLLDQPLQGPVFLRSSSHTLPDLVASLDGQIHIDLVGRIDAVHGRLRTIFAAVPDASVGAFMLTMKGGKKGLLQNTTNICAGKPRALARFKGHNGRRSSTRSLLHNKRCAGAGRKAKRPHRAHRRAR